MNTQLRNLRNIRTRDDTTKMQKDSRLVEKHKTMPFLGRFRIHERLLSDTRFWFACGSGHAHSGMERICTSLVPIMNQVSETSQMLTGFVQSHPDCLELIRKKQKKKFGKEFI